METHGRPHALRSRGRPLFNKPHAWHQMDGAQSAKRKAEAKATAGEKQKHAHGFFFKRAPLGHLYCALGGYATLCLPQWPPPDAGEVERQNMDYQHHGRPTTVAKQKKKKKSRKSRRQENPLVAKCRVRTKRLNI